MRARRAVGGFVGAAFLAGELGFGGDEAAFAGGLEHRGAVSLEAGPGALEGGDGVIQPGELGLDRRHDLLLLVERRQ